jgi:hypothetical protein
VNGQQSFANVTAVKETSNASRMFDVYIASRGKRSTRKTLKRLVRVAREAWKETSRCAPQAAKLGGSTAASQFFDELYVALKYEISPPNYYRLGLYRPENRREVRMYVATQAHDRFLRKLGCDLHTSRDDLRDKRRFCGECLRHGLPTATILAEFDEGRVAWYGDAVLLPRNDVFSKEALGERGEGATLWTYVSADDAWRAGDGPLMKDAELVAYLAKCSAGKAIILQPGIVNHPALARLSSGALCTVRMMTCRSFSGAPELLASLFRMPVAHPSVDNYSQGGLASPVNANGTLGAAVAKRLPEAMVRVEQHPLTRHRIVGTQVPFWDEAVKLVLTAHAAFPQYPSIGWDVAITPNGATLIEANDEWCVRLAQHALGRPLGGTRLSDCYLSWADHVTQS